MMVIDGVYLGEEPGMTRYSLVCDQCRAITIADAPTHIECIEDRVKCGCCETQRELYEESREENEGVVI